MTHTTPTPDEMIAWLDWYTSNIIKSSADTYQLKLIRSFIASHAKPKAAREEVARALALSLGVAIDQDCIDENGDYKGINVVTILDILLPAFDRAANGSGG